MTDEHPATPQQLELLRTAARARKQRPEPALAQFDPVAVVMLDLGVAHLDRTFEYAVPADNIQAAITSVFDLRPAAIVEQLDLLRPIYKPTAAYGHFGRTTADGVDNPFTWEQTNRVEQLQAAAR